MKLVYSCMIAVSMYSKLPVPQVEWTKERMKHVMCFFPLVGVFTGLVMGLWFYLAFYIFGLSLASAALGAAAIPVLITGGIHIDGYLDTMDAIHSYGDREKKLAILKDPHVGAFAIISMAVYTLLYAGAVYEYGTWLLTGRLGWKPYMIPAFFMAFERALSGLSVVSFPSAKKDGLAASFAKAAEKKTDRAVLIFWILGLLALSFAMGGLLFFICIFGILAVQFVVFMWYFRMSRREFGGITGDLAGCFLQLAELAGFWGMVILLKVIL